MSTPNVIQRICDALEAANLETSLGKLSCTLDNITLNLKTKDIMGSVIQEWFGHWMQEKGFRVSSPPNSQTFPDFVLDNLYDVDPKAFDVNKKPNFDVAPFPAYIESLNSNPNKLNAFYFIFAYEIVDQGFYIRKFWLKHVWELAGPARKYPVTLQVKRGHPYNIRPVNISSKRPRSFASRKEFCESLHASALNFKESGINIRGHDINWLSNLEVNYTKATQEAL